MKTIALFVAILTLSLSAYAQKPAESSKVENIAAKLDTTVPWLQAKIWEYQSKAVSSPARSVIKTTFEGKPVYYVPPVCCDIPGELYAEDGALMCYPSGGITGNGDGKCPMFRIEYSDNTKNSKDNKTSLVWADKRKPATDIISTRVKSKRVPNLQ
jgi:hypothetical protein